MNPPTSSLSEYGHIIWRVSMAGGAITTLVHHRCLRQPLMFSLKSICHVAPVLVHSRTNPTLSLPDSWSHNPEDHYIDTTNIIDYHE